MLFGQSEAERGALVRGGRCLKPAVVKIRVFGGDCESEAGSTRGALARGVGSPETVEHSIHLCSRHSDTVVTHGDCDCRFTLGYGNLDGLSFAMFDGVREEVAKIEAEVRAEISKRSKDEKPGLRVRSRNFD